MKLINYNFQITSLKQFLISSFQNFKQFRIYYFGNRNLFVIWLLIFGAYQQNQRFF